MESFTNAELADMNLEYGAADCNERAAARLYSERYPMRCIPNHQTFTRLHQRLCKTHPFERRTMNQVRTVRTSHIEEIVLRHTVETPRISTRAIATCCDLSKSTVYKDHELELIAPIL